MTLSDTLPQLRAPVLAVVWAAAVLGLVTGWDAPTEIAEAGLVLFVLLALPDARRETLVIAVPVGAVAILALATVGDPEHAIEGLERSLLFAALMPTLQLTRAVARRMRAVRESQTRIGALPGRSADVGILLGSHAFGSVLNTGAFALMGAVMPDDAPDARRRSAAMASLRGMNISIFWSPFFVGFAVAAAHLPEVPLWQVMPLGWTLVAGAFVIGLVLFARPIDLGGIAAALRCLAPVVLRLGIAAGCVVAFSQLTPYSTLGSVVLVMPVLCCGQLLRRRDDVRDVGFETWRRMGRMGDDLMLVTVAIVTATIAGGSPALLEWLAPVIGDGLPGPVAVALLIGIQVLPAMVGVHPIITGTVMIGALTALPGEVADLALFEAMLVGWGLGSMISISSLSLVTSGAMFRTPPVPLAYGPNLIFAACVTLWSIAVLSLVDRFWGG